MERSSVRTLDRITEGSNKEIDKGIDKEMDKEMDKEIDKGIDKEIGKGIGKDITKSDLVPGGAAAIESKQKLVRSLMEKEAANDKQNYDRDDEGRPHSEDLHCALRGGRDVQLFRDDVASPGHGQETQKRGKTEEEWQTFLTRGAWDAA